VKPQENQGVITDPINDFFIGYEKANLDPTEESVDRQRRRYEFRQLVPSRADEKGGRLLIVIKARKKNHKDC
jgi:hypothetical protein